MRYHELTRKELQTLCKQNKLPANKTNAVMASSLTSFFADQETLTQAYAHVFTPSTSTKSDKTRLKPKLEKLDTSLASLELGSEKASTKGSQDTLLKNCKEPVAQSAFTVSPPAHSADSTLLPNTTLRRRSKKSTTIKKLSVGAEGASSRDIAPDSTGNLRLPSEEISIHSSATVVKKCSTPEPQLAPHLNADVLVTDDQSLGFTRGPQHQEVVASKTGVGIVVKKVMQLSSPSESESFAIYSAHNQANVDTLIRRATGMLEKFEEWKIDNPNKDVVHSSGQKHLSSDKEDLYQQSPCNNSKLRNLQGHMSDNATPLERKSSILNDITLNAHT